MEHKTEASSRKKQNGRWAEGGWREVKEASDWLRWKGCPLHRRPECSRTGVQQYTEGRMKAKEEKKGGKGKRERERENAV